MFERHAITDDEHRGLSVIFTPEGMDDPYIMEVTERYDQNKEDTVRITEQEALWLLEQLAKRRRHAIRR